MNIFPNKISLLTQWFTPNSEERQDEMLQALQINCENRYINRVILLNESNEVAPYKHEKLSQVEYGKRLTFGDAYNYIVSKGENKEAWCIVNSDIAFDSSLQDLSFESPDDVYCLTRYDFKKDQYTDLPRAINSDKWELKHINGHPVEGSQDTWIILNPKRELSQDYFTKLEAKDIHFGVPGCDNKISLILRLSGFRCQNPSKTIKTYHYHFKRDESFLKKRIKQYKYCYPSPYLFMQPVYLGERANNVLNIKAKLHIEGTDYEFPPQVSNTYAISIFDDTPLEQLQYNALFSV